MKNYADKNVRELTGVRRGISVIAALLCASMLSLVVFGSVIYDSSKDPVVAYSAMEAYVEEEISVLQDTINDLSARLAVVELTGGGGSGSGSGMNSEAATQLLARIANLEAGLAEAKSENAALSAQLKTAKTELNALIADLQSQYDDLGLDIENLSDSITALNSEIAKVKTNVTTLQNNFKQVSDISTKLAQVTYKVDALTAENGDVNTLKKDVAFLREEYSAMLEKMGQLYEAVYVPCNATIYARDAEDSLVIVLRTGSAIAVSPFTDPGTAQGLNDLSDGTELYDGAAVTLFHNVLIPRGGDDGRGVKITGYDGSYVMIGGDYIIVEEQQ